MFAIAVYNNKTTKKGRYVVCLSFCTRIFRGCFFKNLKNRVVEMNAPCLVTLLYTKTREHGV